jgi:hypothetical protein
MSEKNNYVTRPRTKPESTTKGKLNEWANGYKEFVPQGQKPSNRTMLKQVGGSSFYKSEGTKESSYSLHLNVDAKDCEDPVAALHEQFLFLTEGEQKQKPQMPEGCRGQMLADNGNMKIWMDSENGKLVIMTELECAPDIERQLLQAQAQMNVCIGRHRTEILNNNNK